jgi:hypothetical protein
MPAFWVFPLDILVWAADPATATLMTPLIAYLHPRAFPFVDFSRTKYCADLIRALRHANIMVEDGEMGFSITLKPKEILFFLNICCGHYFTAFQARYIS